MATQATLRAKLDKMTLAIMSLPETDRTIPPSREFGIEYNELRDSVIDLAGVVPSRRCEPFLPPRILHASHTTLADILPWLDRLAALVGK